MSAFYQKHFLKPLGLVPAELTSLFQLTAQPKTDKKNGTKVAKLTDKNIVLTFEKDSARTRCSFEVATHDQGARVTYLRPSDSQIGHEESIEDTARILGRVYDDIQYRSHGQEVVEMLAEYTGVPVRNGLTNKFHPTQLLADLLAMQEHLSGKAFNGTALVYADNTRNNMDNPMLEAAMLTGLDLRLVASQTRWSEESLVTEYKTLTQEDGSSITLAKGVAIGMKNTDFIYTDVWVLVGEAEEKWAGRTALLRKYQTNNAMVTLIGNPQVEFLHCLPAFHDNQTTLGKQMVQGHGLHSGMEVTSGVFEFPASIVLDQAENRMHTIKAVMVATLAK